MGKPDMIIRGSYPGESENERYTLEELNKKLIVLEDGKALDNPLF